MNAVLPDKYDQPIDLPQVQVNGKPLKPITRTLMERRATSHFTDKPVPREYVTAILELGLQAPSGYNLQPWRFIVVQDGENRKRLQKAAMDQAKVGEAPVVIIAYAVKDAWKSEMHRIFTEGAKRGVGEEEKIPEQEKTVNDFLGNFPAATWLNRHTMIAFTTMIIAAESYGLDTAPMEGFDPAEVKEEFNLPTQAEVVALLAIGYATTPDKPYPGRLPLAETVCEERYGNPWRENKED